MMRIFTLLMLAAFLSCALITPGLAAEDASTAAVSESEPLLAHGFEGETIEVRPLADPESPYAGKYSWLEHWAMDHLQQGSTWEEASAVGKDALTETKLNWAADDELQSSREVKVWLMVDVDGFVIPAAEYKKAMQGDFGFSFPSFKEVYEPNATLGEIWEKHRHFMLDLHISGMHREERQKLMPQIFWLNAMGEMNPDQLKRWRTSIGIEEATQMPVVPAWLAKAPPAETYFLPDGKIITRGPLGIFGDELPDESDVFMHISIENGLPWHLYSPDGRLLQVEQSKGDGSDGRIRPREYLRVFWGDFEPMQEVRSRSTFFLHGYVAVLDPDEIERHTISIKGPFDEKKFREEKAKQPPTIYPATPLYIYKYDGTEVSLDDRYEFEYNPHHFSRIFPSRLARIYETQVALGISGPETASPYEGQADGPQRHVGEPLDPDDIYPQRDDYAPPQNPDSEPETDESS